MTGAPLSPDNPPWMQPIGLDDLPEQRREALLWRYALTLDYHGVDELVRETSGQPCPIPGGLVPASQQDRVAVLGSDGRYHLLLGGHPICVRTQRPQRTPAGPVWPHQDWCPWWNDGAGYRLHPPPGKGRDHRERRAHAGSRRVRWLVTPTGTTRAPELIQRAARCPIKVSLGHWPHYLGAGARARNLVTALIDALGPDCHACGHNLGDRVDHDHFLGLARGLLCGHCNSHVDECPHARGCRWADYLNSPPALPLGLQYPTPAKTLLSRQPRIDYLGIDPFADQRGAR